MALLNVTMLRPALSVPSNFTDKDVLNHVRHHYPDAGPLLQELFDRFENLVEAKGTHYFDDDRREVASDAVVKCGNCGSLLKIEFDQMELSKLYAGPSDGGLF